jgi:uncharacterized protein with ATP-grasp and redox domains
LDLGEAPPAMGQQIHRLIREALDEPDPYDTIKRRFNEHGRKLRDQLRQRVHEAVDPFRAAVRLAIAGNRIDFGPRGDVTEQEISALTEVAFSQVLKGEPDRLRNTIDEAEQILFLADNAGEIALDMLLLEQMPTDKVTVAVRGTPVLNDATLADAEAVGLTELVEVIDNGSDAPGTLLTDCSATFCAQFDQADLIISKGQGNYESLAGQGRHRVPKYLSPTVCETHQGPVIPLIAADCQYHHDRSHRRIKYCCRRRAA